MSEHGNSGVGAPLFTPTGLNQHYTDTSNGDLYLSNGIASLANWVLQGGGGSGGLTAPVSEIDATGNAAQTIDLDGTATAFEITVDQAIALTFSTNQTDTNCNSSEQIECKIINSGGGAIAVTLALFIDDNLEGFPGQMLVKDINGLVMPDIAAAGAAHLAITKLAKAGTTPPTVDAEFNILNVAPAGAAIGDIVDSKLFRGILDDGNATVTAGTDNVGILTGEHGSYASGAATVTALADNTNKPGAALTMVNTFTQYTPASVTVTNNCKSGFLMGYGYGYNQAATLENTNEANFTFGKVNAGRSAAAVRNAGYGSALFGEVKSYNAGVGASVENTAGSKGGFTSGSVYSYGGQAKISGEGVGSFTQGRAISEIAVQTAIVTGSGEGSFTQGFCRQLSGAVNATLAATGAGAFAQGYSLANGTASNITSSGKGTVAMGFANNGDIIASADGAIQFGIGNNATANTVQVGNGGLMFHMADGVPGVLANGMFFMDAGVVKVRSNGITVSL